MDILVALYILMLVKVEQCVILNPQYVILEVEHDSMIHLVTKQVLNNLNWFQFPPTSFNIYSAK